MTEKLFLKDPYLKEFEATIKKITGNQVILDKTAFYPASGGQAADTGTINSNKVIDTKYDENRANITHIIEGIPTFKEGDKITGKINWEKRYQTMKLHSASHIMEHFLFQIFGKMNCTGSNVNEEKDSSTYETAKTLDEENLKKVENLSNEFIQKGHEIKRFEDPDKPGWWQWQCQEIKMPCAGTHVKNTKEIGQIELKRKNSGTNKEKILTSLK